MRWLDPLFRPILNRIERMERILMSLITDLQSDVTAQTTVIASVVTLLEGLKAKLDEAGTDPVALAAIKDSLEANTAALAAAVTANTPSEPDPA